MGRRPREPAPVVLAALRPKMLALSRDAARGAHPYFVPPEHTARAREILGKDAWLCPEQMVLLETDASKARAIARQNMQIYIGLPNYRNNLKWLGFADARLRERRQRPAGRRDRRVGRREGDRRPHPGPPRRGRRPRLHPVVPGRRRPRLRQARARDVRARRGSSPAMARRKFWGWGNEGDGPNEEQARGIARDARGALRRRRRARARAAPRGRRAAGAARRAAARARRRLLAPTPTRARRTPTASPTATSCAARAATSRPRPTSWPSRATRPTSRRCSTGAASAASRRSRTAAARAWSAASRRASATATRARSRSTSAALSRVLEIDRTSRAARIQAGIYGPALEDALRPHGLTLRHFPQSFEFSTLGGWIATRSGGHYATLYTHIDDFVESLRVVTPTGVVESRRLPGSGAGPSPDRLFLGSEGTLGIITEAWMRLQDRPRFRAVDLGALRGRGGLRARRRRGARARAVGARADATAACSTRARRARRARATARPPCSCSASSPPTTRSTRGSRARSSCAATRAARCPTTRCARAPTTRRRARAPRAPGATRSSTRPTCATRSCARRSSPRRSRPRSPGTRSRPSTPR